MGFLRDKNTSDSKSTTLVSAESSVFSLQRLKPSEVTLPLGG